MQTAGASYVSGLHFVRWEESNGTFALPGAEKAKVRGFGGEILSVRRGISEEKDSHPGHHKMGFEEVGRKPEAARYKDKLVAEIIMWRKL